MYSFVVQIDGLQGAVVEAQVVQAHFGMSLETILEEIYSLKLEGGLRTEMLIVRLPVEENWDPVSFTANEIRQPTLQNTQKLFARSGREDIFARMRDRALHFLTSNGGRYVLTPNLNPNWMDDPLTRYGLKIDEVIAAIRNAEFKFILDQSRAVLTSPPGSVFRAPSGKLLKSFVRVGNIQYSRDAVDAVFFWLLPHLKNVGAILTDTWSISSIAMNVARLSAAYFGGPRRLVEMLPSYNDGSPEARANARSVVERLDTDFRAIGSDQDVMLCLISATQTGSLAKHLENIFANSDLRLRPRSLALFALGDTEIMALYDLTRDPRFKLLDPAESVSDPVRIDPQIYFPLRFEDTVFEIAKPIADRSREFFDRYAGTGLVTLHRTHSDGPGRVRHHAIHLETDRLATTPVFANAFEDTLAQLPSKPKLIVCPPHDAGRSLAQLAKDYFARIGHDCLIFPHETLYLQSDESDLKCVLDNAEEADALLIVDDVFLTGIR